MSDTGKTVVAAKPLEERRVYHIGSLSHRPALDKIWVKDIQFLNFEPYHKDTNSEDWLSAADIIANDLSYLLSLPCHVFWSQVMYDESLLITLDSYLNFAPRELDGESEDTRVKEKLDALHSIYFKVFLRLMTCKESKDDFLSPNIFGEIIYEKYIFDIPKLIDLCTLFKSSNARLLEKMVGNVFLCQPKYGGDLKVAINDLEKVVGEAVDRLKVHSNLSRYVDETALTEQCAFVSDLCVSLHDFLSTYTPACSLFHEHHFYKALCLLYEEMIAVLMNSVRTSRLSDPDLRAAFRRLELAAESCVHTFRLILYTSTLSLVSNKEEDNSKIQQFCDTLTEYVGDVHFISHYDDLYPFLEDYQLIRRPNAHIDETGLNFIQDAISVSKSHRNSTEEDNSSPPPSQNETTTPLNDVPLGAAASLGAAAALSVPVTHIKELFPHLGDGFIEMCLRHYTSPEMVINALLEDSLPQSLANLDRTLEVAIDEHNLLSSRKNVYDNDQFDVFRKRTVDMSNIHKGKRDINMPVCDDDIRGRVLELASRTDDMTIANRAVAGLADTANEAMYDDEYDDTYDSNEIGADDADEASELMGRKMVLPAALGGGRRDDVADEDDKSDSVGQEPKPQNLGNHGYQRPQYDVKGKAKGQGQTQEVTRNRLFKTQHKARGANHNRKAGARYKQSRGMF